MAKKGGNPQNLVPFAKGEDPRRQGNGRKPKLPQVDVIMAEVLGEEKNDITAAKAILMALLSKATKGDVRAAEVLLDRAYGKATTKIEANVATTKQVFVIGGQEIEL